MKKLILTVALLFTASCGSRHNTLANEGVIVFHSSTGCCSTFVHLTEEIVVYKTPDFTEVTKYSGDYDVVLKICMEYCYNTHKN